MPNWHEKDDNTLIQAAQKGQADAFGELYTRHAEAVFRYLYAHVSERQDAEDLTEEVFMRVWRTLARFREQGAPFVAYLIRVGRNALIDHYRKHGRMEPEASTEDLMVADQSPGPAEALAASMEQAAVRRAMEKLREEHRLVLALRFLSELSPEETAQVMGRSPGAVRVLQHRALAALRDVMETM